MNREKFKSYILIIMVVLCIYLSSKVWLNIPTYLGITSNIQEEEVEEIDLWKIICPERYVIDTGENYTVLYNDTEYKLWFNTVSILETCFNDEKIQVTKISNFETKLYKYIKFDFASKIPIELFLDVMKIENKSLKERIINVKSIMISMLEENTIYIYNGNETLKLYSKNNNLQEIYEQIKNFDFNNHLKYNYDCQISGYDINIPVPTKTEVLTPIFVKSEIDITDYEYIKKIAKDYYKEDYDYVRKLEESTGNIIYVYNNEKVLKITHDGLLDFYDAVEEYAEENELYYSLIKALEFVDDFLGFPESGYLNKVEMIQKDGKFGYKFIFSYKIKNKPIIFSQIREEKALEIEVFGNKVVSYNRFIRNIDETKLAKMDSVEVLPAVDVIEKYLDFIIELYLLENDIKNPDIKSIEKELVEPFIKSIKDIHLAYFDLSRMSKEQLLRIVWVVETNDKRYIINAITGSIIEEQEKISSHGLEPKD